MEIISTNRKLLIEKIKLLPEKPGVYQFYDKNRVIIYIGKAINLRKRVQSYFNKDASLSGKVRVLVKKIAEIEIIVVETELDALLLENNLIKKHQPRYNVMLKDDKTFPWICLKNEPFPRVFPTRNRIQDGSEYFGPYASVTMMKTLLDLIRQLYPLRNCKLKLTEANIRAKKFRVCLEYHIGNCRGPCEGFQGQAEYNQIISQIRHIIKGNLTSVTDQLKALMMSYAVDMKFEKAQIVKDKLQLLESYKAKSTIVNTAINDVDVCSIIDCGQSVYCNYLKVIQGAVVQSHTLELRRMLDEATEDLFKMAITEFRQRYTSGAKEIVASFNPGFEIPGVRYTIPRRGDKKMLLELSERNANYFRMEKERQRDLVDPDRRTRQLMESMKRDLLMDTEPRYIECFDNSNIQGSSPVASMVVFRDGKPDKKGYRHFNIKAVTGADDFASMEEIVYRRYKRLTDQGEPLPDLIIVDGGKGQLNSAVKSLEKLQIHHRVKIIGIAKRLEEIFCPGDPVPFYLDKKSVTLKVIQHARNEAHRFGIAHHRNKRSKTMTKSVLSEIEGIGFSTAQKLLWKFKTVKNISRASTEELSKVIGKVRAAKVYLFFNPGQN